MSAPAIVCDGRPIAIRPFAQGEEEAVVAFARTLPEHDLLFLNRDITEPRVVAAWAREIDEGTIESLLAWDGDEVVATTALVRDPLGWSPHVGEARLLVAPRARGCGLGQALANAMIARGIELGLAKLTVRMTVDQVGAIAIFETLGFRGEALLKNHVKDRAGTLHDIAVLSQDVVQASARANAYLAGEESAGAA